jgi:hypothetical protein
MKNQTLFLPLLLLFLEWIKKISCITRNLHYLEEKCVLSDFYSKSNIIITFNVTEGNFKEHELSGPNFVINIYKKEKNKLTKSYETKKTYGKFSFNVKKTDHYKICIIGKDSTIFGKEGYIIYDFMIESSLDVKQRVSESANFKEFEKVNQKMEFINDKVDQIENMQLMANSIENKFSQNQIKISKRIAQISIIQIVIIFGVGIYHVYAIKNMFKDKVSMPF